MRPAAGGAKRPGRMICRTYMSGLQNRIPCMTTVGALHEGPHGNIPLRDQSARHSGESRNPFSPLSLALRLDVLVPGRGRYGHRHMYPPYPFRTRARRPLPRVGIKCKNEGKNHKMDSGFRRNDGGCPALRGFFNNPEEGAFAALGRAFSTAPRGRPAPFAVDTLRIKSL